MCFFGGPPAPPPMPPPPPPPAPEPIALPPLPESAPVKEVEVTPIPKPVDASISQAREKNRAQARAYQGRSATILTSGQGLLEEPNQRKKTLLGN